MPLFWNLGIFSPLVMPPFLSDRVVGPVHTGPARAVFVNVYGAQESIPPASAAWRAGTTKRVVVPAPQAGNRFLGSLKVFFTNTGSVYLGTEATPLSSGRREQENDSTDITVLI